MFDFAELMLGFVMVAFAILLLCLSYALIVGINTDNKISTNNNAHNVQAIRIHLEDEKK